MKKLNNKKNYKIPKYNLGGLTKFGPNGQANAEGAAGLVGMATGFMKEGSKGKGAISGASSGAMMGASLGPIGMGVGAVLGGTLGLLAAGKQQREAAELANNEAIANSKTYGKQFITDNNNQNPYGAQMFKKGGIVKYPDGSVVQKTINKPLTNNSLLQMPFLEIGRGSQMVKVPTQDVIQQLQDPNSLTKTTRKDWDFNNLAHLQSQLNYDDRVDGSGVQNLRYLASRKTQDTGGMWQKPKFADGAEVMQNQINIEKGELQIDPNSGKILREYKGINPETGGLYENHSKKGSDTKNNIVQAEENTFVITKAKSAEYKKAVDNNDKLHLESIKMNIKNNKDAKMGTYKMGSYVKYSDGALVNPFKNQGEIRKFQSDNGLLADGIFGKNTNDAYLNSIKANNVGYHTPIDTKGLLKTLSSTPSANLGTSQNLFKGQLTPNAPIGDKYNPKLGNGFSNMISSAAQYAPALMNIGQGLFGKTETMAKVQPQVNPFQNDILSNMPEQISSQPLIDELNRGVRGQFRNIDNRTSGSPIARANKNSVFASSQNSISSIRMNEQMMNNQIRGQRGSIFANLGQQRMNAGQQADSMNFQIDNINAQNRGMKDQRLNQGISQLQQTYMNNQHNDRLYGTDMYKADLLREMLPNLKYNDLFSSDMLSKIGRKG